MSNGMRQRLGQRISRRALLRATARAGLGAAALSAVGTTAPKPPTAQASRPADGVVSGGLMARQMAGPYYSGVTSLDPYEDLSFRGWFAANFHYSKLLQAVSSGEGVSAGNFAQFENDLAASMPEMPDAATYVFTVREDARWHDIEPLNGRRVTTDDIWESYRRFRQLSARAGDWDRVVENASAIPQERTIRFDLREPHAPFLTLVGSSSHLWIIPPEIVEDGTVASRPIGSGPWIFESYQPDELMSWRRNPAWHRSRDFVSGRVSSQQGGYRGSAGLQPQAFPLVDRMQASVSGDTDPRLFGLSEGTLDFAGVDIQQYSRLREESPQIEDDGLVFTTSRLLKNERMGSWRRY